MISFAITDEHVHDAKVEREMLKSVKERIKRIFADKGYDSKSIYNTFGENTIIPQGRMHPQKAGDHLQEQR